MLEILILTVVVLVMKVLRLLLQKLPQIRFCCYLACFCIYPAKIGINKQILPLFNLFLKVFHKICCDFSQRMTTSLSIFFHKQLKQGKRLWGMVFGNFGFFSPDWFNFIYHPSSQQGTVESIQTFITVRENIYLIGRLAAVNMSRKEQCL